MVHKDEKGMEVIDKSNMRKIILEFPKQFGVGLKAAKNIGTKGSFDKVLVCGMGGSALPADILNMWLEDQKMNLSLHIHRDYGLPYWADKKDLAVCISYSGNTEETLSAFEEARKKNLKILAIASGGKLAQLCRSHNIPIAIIPAGLQPRMALGFQFAALMKILANSGLIQSDLKDISDLENLLKPKTLENQGKKIAKNLKNKIPIVYASRKFQYLARIWKIKFNENSKTPAFYNYFPELNHNELVGFENNGSPTSIIILRDANDLPRIKKRMGLTASIMKERDINVNIDIIEILGKNTINKIFSSILLADWASYYLALGYKVDPTPVKLNDEFKKRLLK
ncbi:MAG: bifunctional phosphoglucose/phosphomannose isomerase [Candidatus Nealsonbacteria bacterium]|nr:bifunctional phosphoglucose/phosphomannose isomerase [Candidatus Nealsonbacteria bacterium]